MGRPKSIKEVEYEILKYIMFNTKGNFGGLTDLYKSLGGICSIEGHLVNPDHEDVTDRALQKRINTATKNVKNVIGNMIDSRIKYLTEEHIDFGINNYEELK
jgi:hypothetical protein|tara:strand:- start:355 stop:660 length:306 start_codon:yes stop_codon:yes gene_type:complete